jgi:hypothetical protein
MHRFAGNDWVSHDLDPVCHNPTIFFKGGKKTNHVCLGRQTWSALEQVESKRAKLPVLFQRQAPLQPNIAATRSFSVELACQSNALQDKIQSWKWGRLIIRDVPRFEKC